MPAGIAGAVSFSLTFATMAEARKGRPWICCRRIVGQIQRGLRGRGGRGVRAPLDLSGEKEIVEGETGRGRRVGGWRRKKKMSPSKTRSAA
uniref:Uncharacterized protein n=1 Tax=Oryza glumipatula TaxID=40148 RepID=A0A0D9ZY54_9ORYZ